MIRLPYRGMFRFISGCVSYRYRRNGGEGRDIAENISLVTTHCHLGGERFYFICLGSSRGDTRADRGHRSACAASLWRAGP